MTDYLVKMFKSETGIDLSRDEAALCRVREAAEKAKIELSSTTVATINLPFLTADRSGPKHMDLSLTRAKFDELTRHLVDSTMGPVQQAMADSGLRPSDLSKVCLLYTSSPPAKIIAGHC